VGIVVDQLFFSPPVIVNQVLVDVNKGDPAQSAGGGEFPVEGFGIGGALFP